MIRNVCNFFVRNNPQVVRPYTTKTDVATHLHNRVCALTRRLSKVETDTSLLEKKIKPANSTKDKIEKIGQGILFGVTAGMLSLSFQLLGIVVYEQIKERKENGKSV